MLSARWLILIVGIGSLSATALIFPGTFDTLREQASNLELSDVFEGSNSEPKELDASDLWGDSTGPLPSWVEEKGLLSVVHFHSNTSVESQRLKIVYEILGDTSNLPIQYSVFDLTGQTKFTEGYAVENYPTSVVYFEGRELGRFEGLHGPKGIEVLIQPYLQEAGLAESKAPRQLPLRLARLESLNGIERAPTLIERYRPIQPATGSLALPEGIIAID